MSTWYDHLRALLAAVDGLPPAEAVEALQAAQQAVQDELARRWAANASPGHRLDWPPAGGKESER